MPQTLRGLWPHTPKILGLPGPDPGAFGRSPPNPLEVGLPVPHPGLLFRRRKSNQKAAQGRDPFDGVPPLCIPPPRRHKGGRMPPFGNPRITSGLSVRLWKRLPGLTGLGENPKRGPQPPHWSLRGVVLRRGTQSKVSPSYAPFCLLFRRGKSRSGHGAESPEIKRVGGGAPTKRGMDPATSEQLPLLASRRGPLAPHGAPARPPRRRGPSAPPGTRR